MQQVKKLKNKKVNNDTVIAREEAKILGGKALIGTIKQKNWAEKIRGDFIKSARNEDIIHELLNPKSKIYMLSKCAKFWIENKDKKESEFIAFVSEFNDLYDKKVNLIKNVTIDSRDLLVRDDFYFEYKDAEKKFDECIRKWCE